MRFASAFAVVMITACAADNAPSTRSPLSPTVGANRSTSGIPEPVDPIPQSASPIRVSITGSILVPYSQHFFTATASGAESGNYNFDWMLQTCDMEDYCHDYELWQTTQSPTNTFTLVIPPGSAYARVKVYAREVGVANYFTSTSNGVFVKGPDWGQFVEGGSIGGTCASNSYPFLEQYFDTLTSTNKTRNYSRDVCTGTKVYQ
jgi:hypothetical protein